MAQTVTCDDLSTDPNRGVSALLPTQFALFGNGFGLTKRHTVRTDAFSSEIKALSHIWQFHAPAMVFAGRGPAVELGTAFIAGQFLHGIIPLRLVESWPGLSLRTRQFFMVAQSVSHGHYA